MGKIAQSKRGKVLLFCVGVLFFLLVYILFEFTLDEKIDRGEDVIGVVGLLGFRLDLRLLFSHDG